MAVASQASAITASGAQPWLNQRRRRGQFPMRRQEAHGAAMTVHREVRGQGGPAGQTRGQTQSGIAGIHGAACRRLSVGLAAVEAALRKRLAERRRRDPAARLKRLRRENEMRRRYLLHLDEEALAVPRCGQQPFARRAVGWLTGCTRVTSGAESANASRGLWRPIA